MYIVQNDSWYLERLTWLMGGIVTLLGCLLGWLLSPWWLLLAAFAGLNLTIFALTGFCIGANILYKLGATPRLQK
ncbi:MAG: DUF2892 domain-containing protein [Cyanobacteriota bacterium]